MESYDEASTKDVWKWAIYEEIQAINKSDMDIDVSTT